MFSFNIGLYDPIFEESGNSVRPSNYNNV